MKYKNDWQVFIRIGYIMLHFLILYLIFFSDLKNEPFAVCIILTLFLTLCIVVLDFLFFTTKYMFYYTYFSENGVKQKLLGRKKEIFFSEVKYVYLIGSFAILSSKKELDVIEDKNSLIKNRKILNKLKHNVVVFLSEMRYKAGSVSNAGLIIVLQAKCENAQFIKIGKIPQHIDKYIED